MEFLKRYKSVIIIVLPILVLVLIRQFGVIHFKSDAKKWSELSINQANIIPFNQIEILPEEKLIINLGKEAMELNGQTVDSLNIPADSILCKKYLYTLRKYKGTLLLFSDEKAVSARIWMILSQMGYKNIFILANDKDDEVFKNKFRPDTLTTSSQSQNH